MLDELIQIDDKLDQLLALCRELRAENHALRARIALLESENGRLTERMASARSRLESLMDRLPAA